MTIPAHTTKDDRMTGADEMAMAGKVCVVTGPTSGIGRATALGLAAQGARVVLLARNPSKAAAVAAEMASIPGAPKAEVVVADLTEMKEVRRAADEISRRFDHVDVLINNAGGMFDTHHQSSDGIEDAYAVNHLAVFLLTLALHPSLKRAHDPRVVIVSSNVHEKAGYVRDYGSLLAPRYAWSRIYAQTKLRNVIFAQALSERWKAEGITVNSLHPGVVDTGLMSGWENLPMKLLFGFVQRFFMSPEQGARTSIFLASDPSVAAVTGRYFARRQIEPHNPVADDPVTQDLLWEESMRFLRQAGIDDLSPTGASLSGDAR